MSILPSVSGLKANGGAGLPSPFPLPKVPTDLFETRLGTTSSSPKEHVEYLKSPAGQIKLLLYETRSSTLRKGDTVLFDPEAANGDLFTAASNFIYYLDNICEVHASEFSVVELAELVQTRKQLEQMQGFFFYYAKNLAVAVANMKEGESFLIPMRYSHSAGGHYVLLYLSKAVTGCTLICFDPGPSEHVTSRHASGKYYPLVIENIDPAELNASFFGSLRTRGTLSCFNSTEPMTAHIRFYNQMRCLAAAGKSAKIVVPGTVDIERHPLYAPYYSQGCGTRNCSHKAISIWFHRAVGSALYRRFKAHMIEEQLTRLKAAVTPLLGSLEVSIDSPHPHIGSSYCLPAEAVKSVLSFVEKELAVTKAKLAVDEGVSSGMKRSRRAFTGEEVASPLFIPRRAIEDTAAPTPTVVCSPDFDEEPSAFFLTAASFEMTDAAFAEL